MKRKQIGQVELFVKYVEAQESAELMHLAILDKNDSCMGVLSLAISVTVKAILAENHQGRFKRRDRLRQAVIWGM